MATTREELKARVIDLKESWFDDITNQTDPRTHFDKMIDSAISKMDLNKCDDNYIPAHIIFAAILEKYAYAHINGSCDKEKSKRYEREKNNLKKQLSLISN